MTQFFLSIHFLHPLYSTLTFLVLSLLEQSSYLSHVDYSLPHPSYSVSQLNRSTSIHILLNNKAKLLPNRLFFSILILNLNKIRIHNFSTNLPIFQLLNIDMILFYSNHILPPLLQILNPPAAAHQYLFQLHRTQQPAPSIDHTHVRLKSMLRFFYHYIHLRKNRT